MTMKKMQTDPWHLMVVAALLSLQREGEIAGSGACSGPWIYHCHYGVFVQLWDSCRDP